MSALERDEWNALTLPSIGPRLAVVNPIGRRTSDLAAGRSAAQGRLHRATLRFDQCIVRAHDRWLRQELDAIADQLRQSTAQAAQCAAALPGLGHAATLAAHAVEATEMAISVARRQPGAAWLSVDVHRCLHTVRLLTKSIAELTAPCPDPYPSLVRGK
jgi:hypothetical protein